MCQVVSCALVELQYEEIMADLPEGDGFTWVGNNRREGEGHPREGQEGQVEEEQSAGSGGMRGDNHAARITFQSPIVQSSPATRSAYDSTMQPLRPHCELPSLLSTCPSTIN